MITADEQAEHSVVGVVDHFSDRRLTYRTEARALTTADDCLKEISIRCRTETVPGTDSVNKFSYSLVVFGAHCVKVVDKTITMDNLR